MTAKSLIHVVVYPVVNELMQPMGFVRRSRKYWERHRPGILQQFAIMGHWTGSYMPFWGIGIERYLDARAPLP